MDKDRFVVERTADGRYAVRDTVRGTLATGMKDRARAEAAAARKSAAVREMTK